MVMWSSALCQSGEKRTAPRGPYKSALVAAFPAATAAHCDVLIEKLEKFATQNVSFMAATEELFYCGAAIEDCSLFYCAKPNS